MNTEKKMVRDLVPGDVVVQVTRKLTVTAAPRATLRKATLLVMCERTTLILEANGEVNVQVKGA